MILKAITKFIENNTSFTTGTTLQFGHRPDNAPDDCSLIAEIDRGELTFYLPDREDKLITILTRATTYLTAQANSKTIFDLLHGTAGWQLPEVVVGEKYEALTVEALEPPRSLGRDKKGRFEFTVDYIFRIQDRP